jgi:hypothetical protein
MVVVSSADLPFVDFTKGTEFTNKPLSERRRSGADWIPLAPGSGWHEFASAPSASSARLTRQLRRRVHRLAGLADYRDALSFGLRRSNASRANRIWPAWPVLRNALRPLASIVASSAMEKFGIEVRSRGAAVERSVVGQPAKLTPHFPAGFDEVDISILEWIAAEGQRFGRGRATLRS